MEKQITSLTEIERFGLKSEFNFADGHAYHDLSDSQWEIIHSLPQIWEKSSKKRIPDMEKEYQHAFTQLAQSPSLIHYPHFVVCPTASNSIDTVGTWLAENKLRVALVEPTFDNLYLILKRRGVVPTPIDEQLILNKGIAEASASVEEYDALFLVNPNNPTGSTLSKQQFVEIVKYCKEKDKVLLLDNTFRFFVNPSYDGYQILLDSEVTFLSIEDTGKVWPTQDMKASLLFFSENIATEVREIYEEIYLCVSNFTLGVLTHFLEDAFSKGLSLSVWKDVAERRKLFRQAIAHTPLLIEHTALHSHISVEWVKIQSGFESDLEIAEYFRTQNIVLLPGRNFFWSQPELKGTTNIRFSLLKTKQHFLQSIQALHEGLKAAFPGDSYSAQRRVS